MSAAHKPARHVRAHAAQPHHSQLHVLLLALRSVPCTVAAAASRGCRTGIWAAPRLCETIKLASLLPAASQARSSSLSPDAREGLVVLVQPVPESLPEPARLLPLQMCTSVRAPAIPQRRHR